MAVSGVLGSDGIQNNSSLHIRLASFAIAVNRPSQAGEIPTPDRLLPKQISAF
jgi:hypothetical protein